MEPDNGPLLWPAEHYLQLIGPKTSKLLRANQKHEAKALIRIYPCPANNFYSYIQLINHAHRLIHQGIELGQRTSSVAIRDPSNLPEVRPESEEHVQWLRARGGVKKSSI